MTNPRVVIRRERIDGKWTDILDVEATKQLRNRPPLSNEEIEETLREAECIENEYFRLRVKALVGIAKKIWQTQSRDRSFRTRRLET